MSSIDFAETFLMTYGWYYSQNLKSFGDVFCSSKVYSKLT